MGLSSGKLVGGEKGSEESEIIPRVTTMGAEGRWRLTGPAVGLMAGAPSRDRAASREPRLSPARRQGHRKMGAGTSVPWREDADGFVPV